MSAGGALTSGKRPLSDIAREAEANGRAAKKRVPLPHARAPPISIRSIPSYNTGETVYRILCPASKTGSIIGKGGSIIKAIRHDTGSMIRIEEAVFGCDERVVSVMAREDGFRPQKFRSPGNYRKSGGQENEENIFDNDAEMNEEQPAGIVGPASEETTMAVSVTVEEIEDASKQSEAGTEEEKSIDVESDKDKGVIVKIESIESTETKVENLANMHEQTLAKGDEVPEVMENRLSEMVPAKSEPVEEEVRKALIETTEANEENGDRQGVYSFTDSGSDHKERGIAPVQEALLRVHLRILEADPTKPEENHAADRGEGIVTRLLVPTSQVGCLLGKQGKIVSRMREESGAQIRVLPKDQLPTCASQEDEIVQITGDLTAVRKALLAVSTQLRNNPPKRAGEDAKRVPHLAEEHPKISSFTHAKRSAGRSPPRHSLGKSLGVGLPFGVTEVMYRLMCPKDKIGSIIGKGGSIVQSIREKTGAKISIDLSSDIGEDRVIHVSAHESREDAFSKAQRAVMILHNRILAAGQDKDGLVTAKLLVPADQAGCLLGKGGAIIIEMRKSTRAKIHIYGREQLPRGALKVDELVEVVGNSNASQEALMQITARLRNNLLYGTEGRWFEEPNLPPFSGLASPSEGPYPSRQQMTPAPPPYERFQASYEDSMPTRPYSHEPWPSEQAQTYTAGVRSKGLPEYAGSVHMMESDGEPERFVDTRPNSAFITSQTVEVIVPEHTISSIVGESGSNLQQICKISGARVKVNGVAPGALERVVEISGTPDQTHAAQSLLQAFILSGQ